MTKRFAFLLYAFLVLYTIGPVLLFAACSLLATHFDCNINEGSPSPCFAFGHDIGSTLYLSQALLLVAFFTVPTGFIALVVLIVIRLTAKPAKPVNVDKTQL